MINFAGYEMPVRYSSLIEEHKTVRNSVGIFDVSHMGEFIVQGPKAIDLLQYVTSNDVEKLFIGKAQYSCLPNEKGGIVDDLIVYRLDENKYMLVVNAANIEKDWTWIGQHNNFGAELKNISEMTSLFAVQGPKAEKTLQPLTEVKLNEIPFYEFRIGELAGVTDIIISATGYTGSGGYELYVGDEHAERVWNAVLEIGESMGIKPIGLGARDTLRIEAGYCLYGNDIDENTSPIEAKLGWITKLNKEFVNHQELRDQKEKGVSRKLVGLEMIEKGIPRPGYEIQDASGNIIGNITSGTVSPTLNKNIGMGYVKTGFDKPGTKVKVAIRNRVVEAEVVKLPFYKPNK